MAKPDSSTPIFIDALSFAQKRKSGVGHIAEKLTLALEQEIRESGKHRRIYLVVPLRKSKYVKKYVNEIVRIKTIPLPGKIFHAINKFNLLPPLDLFLGKGDYIFPNYRNWRLLFSRSFTYIHDLSYLHYEQFVEPKNLAYLKKNIPRWVKRADVILTASKYTKKEIITYLHLDENKISIIPHGVDMKDFYHREMVDSKKVLKKYGIKAYDFILHVGNIEPRKNIRGLIEAYSKLEKDVRARHPLVLVGGDGWLNDAEKKAIKDGVSAGLEIIQPSSYVEDEDLPYFYSAAGVLAMPSFYEGFGVPPLQAAACGTLIVVGDNSSLSEIFGDVAILVDPLDVTDIKKGLEKALKISAKDIAAYKVAASRLVITLSWRNSAMKLLRVID
jgi:glycosyltransferase involved in cell wall biosynthesis